MKSAAGIGLSYMHDNVPGIVRLRRGAGFGYRAPNGRPLRSHHVDVAGGRIRFRFRGKSGKRHAVELDDAQLARIIRRCRDLPGYELFQYLEGGTPRSVDSDDINAYLQRITGRDYSAKDFRTWGG